jgi:hypothetical protein
MLTGLAAASSHLLSTGENWSITGAILCTLSCLGLHFFPRPEDESVALGKPGGRALGRWKGAQLVAVLSPLLIVA